MMRASIWLMMGGLIAGLFGYIFQVLMGRMLTVEDYGLFNVLIAHAAMLSAPISTLMMIVSRKVSWFRASKNYEHIKSYYFSIMIRAVCVSALLTILWFVFTGRVQAYLKVSDTTPIYLMGIVLLLTVPKIINYSFLQGLQSFKWLSVHNVFDVVLKTVAALVFIQFGYGVAGALGGTIFANIIVWFGIYFVVRHRMAIKNGNTSPIKDNYTFKSILPVLVANTAFVAMTQMDIILVKYFFSAEEAGYYAAASILGKAMMYLSGAIALAIFPIAAEDHARGEQNSSLLIQAVVLTLVVCISGAIFYFVFGEWVITLLYGSDYQIAGELLKYFGIAIAPMGVIIVAEHYLIARGRVLFAYLFIVMAPLQFAMITMFHDSLLAILAVIGIIGLLHASLGLGLLWRDLRAKGGQF